MAFFCDSVSSCQQTLLLNILFLHVSNSEEREDGRDSGTVANADTVKDGLQPPHRILENFGIIIDS